MSVISRDGEVIESLRPLLDYFDVENRPMTAIGWTRSRSAAILRGLLNGKDLSHEALDAESNTAAANFLRALLVFTGVLPGRASELDDTLEWLAQRLGAVQPQHQTIVRRYACGISCDGRSGALTARSSSPRSALGDAPPVHRRHLTPVEHPRSRRPPSPFALGPTALTTMRVEQVVEHEDRVELIVGRTPIHLPDSLADLVLQQRNADEEAMSGWLFPGQHLNPDSLAVRTKQRLGIGVRPSRSAALAHLAKELPVPVPADYLGLAHTTASQWAALVERQWTEYIVLRRAQDPA